MNNKYPEKILIVDDEQNILAALERQLRGTFNVVTAEDGHNGLRVLQEQGPFAVIVSDMRMPEMNGIQLLVQAAKFSPDTVRMMLTGNADLETAMHALNEGNIFRFLVKPCQKATMDWALEDGIKQYRLIMAERELLEKTLKGSVQVLTNILELVNPLAFSRTSRITNYVSQICMRLKIKDIWQYEMAAMLSQIGCVTVPADTLAAIFAGGEMPESELNMFADHPHVGKQLLSKIPRLETISEMVSGQLIEYQETAIENDALPSDPGLLGAQILRTALDFDSLITRGRTATQALGELKSRNKKYHPSILKTLRDIQIAQIEMQSKVVNILDLNDSMVLADDIYTRAGALLAAKNQKITISVRKLLRNYIEKKAIKETVNVLIPGGSIKELEPIQATMAT
ncbi:MAG: two-component system response regulator [candidate division Zixibacteria bacterium HGW-Zixibacteria-1]|nr:MAG: two-component system response regulator [candidate division Zixibacteria bacterium HGW-Zixibacteria-1]